MLLVNSGWIPVMPNGFFRSFMSRQYVLLGRPKKLMQWLKQQFFLTWQILPKRRRKRGQNCRFPPSCWDLVIQKLRQAIKILFPRQTDTKDLQYVWTKNYNSRVKNFEMAWKRLALRQRQILKFAMLCYAVVVLIENILLLLLLCFESRATKRGQCSRMTAKSVGSKSAE